MNMTCSLLGHEYGELKTDREREVRDNEIAEITRTVEVCERCGDERVVSENTEVRSARQSVSSVTNRAAIGNATKSEEVLYTDIEEAGTIADGNTGKRHDAKRVVSDDLAAKSTPQSLSLIADGTATMNAIESGGPLYTDIEEHTSVEVLYTDIEEAGTIADGNTGKRHDAKRVVSDDLAAKSTPQSLSSIVDGAATVNATESEEPLYTDIEEAAAITENDTEIPTGDRDKVAPERARDEWTASDDTQTGEYNHGTDSRPDELIDTNATVPNLDLNAKRDLLTPEPVETHGGAAADVRIVDLDGERDADRVAVKLPRTAGSVTDDLLERFVQEARNWEELAEHPHVVGLHDWGTEPVPWLALEYMDGGTLAERLGAFDVVQAIWTAAAITRAVWHGHRHGTHHRDLKPQNVLLRETPDGMWDVPKVADWGSARRHADRTSPSAGYTPEYAAPEQIQPDEYDALDERTDVFQLGVVCYELCTGEHPFDVDGSPAAVMMAIISGEPEPASEARETLPAELDDVLHRALATDPSDRYETALDLARDLEDAYETVRTSVSERDTNDTNDGTPDGPSDATDGYTTGDIQRYSRESDREINLFASSLATIEQNEDVEPATVSRSELLRTGWQLIRRLAVLEPWERAAIIDVTIANDDVATRYGPRVLREIDLETWHSWMDTADFSSRRWIDLFQSDDEIESLDDLDRYVADIDRDLADLETLAEAESRRESGGHFSRLRRKIELERKHLSFVREYASENR